MRIDLTETSFFCYNQTKYEYFDINKPKYKNMNPK